MKFIVEEAFLKKGGVIKFYCQRAYKSVTTIQGRKINEDSVNLKKNTHNPSAQCYVT
jgi:hypothetical protein